VTAFSRVPGKEADALRFGAYHFFTGGPAKGSLDLVLNTAHAAPDMDLWLAALSPKGVLCQLGAAPAPLVVPSMPLITGCRSVTGSAIGSPAIIREMLAFAARHGLAATTEVVPMREVNDALDRTRRNLARYRMVLAN
jgi:uncharacterized zinc-type alcohol dehydrogenase-like protein